MKREIIIVVEAPDGDEYAVAHALMRLGFFMIKDAEKNPGVKVKYKDAIDNANNNDD